MLRHYLGIASATRDCFRAGRGDPVERFVAEAGHHPVFELTPA